MAGALGAQRIETDGAYASGMFDPQFVTMNWSGVVAGLFLGVILLSCLYSSAFFSVLRQRFLLWYVARGLAIAALTLALSPLPLGTLFEGGDLRGILGFLGFDLAVALSGPFIASFLERDAIPDRLRKALFWSMLPALCFIPVYWLNDPPIVYYVGRLVTYLAILVMLISALVIAVKRGSRSARFQAFAWGPILTLNLVNVPYHIFVGNPVPQYLTFLFIALAIEFVVTALGIADRFMALKRERDRARAREDALVYMAESDPLTGLANRRGLERRYDDGVKALGILDLDRFKSINDALGHDVGDEVLCHTARALSGGSAFAARLGGEEFVLLFTGDDYLEEAERLRTAITTTIAELNELPIVTASMGLVQTGRGVALKDALKGADREVYRAKDLGRDRLCVQQSGKREDRVWLFSQRVAAS